MEDCFETLISSYLDSKVGIVEHFVSEELAQHLINRLFELKEQNLLKAAGIGNAAKLTQNSAIRSDAIYWLDRTNNNEHENAFLDQEGWTHSNKEIENKNSYQNYKESSQEFWKKFWKQEENREKQEAPIQNQSMKEVY